MRFNQHVVGKCCFGLNWCHGVGNVRPCCGGQDYFLRLTMAQVCGVAPGARNGANVWQLGYYLVLSQQQWGSFAGTMLFLRLTAAGIGKFFAVAAVKRRMFVGARLFRLTGSGASWWRRSQRARLPNGMCALRLTQRRTPDSHGRPPTAPGSSRMMCESHTMHSPHQEGLTCE